MPGDTTADIQAQILSLFGELELSLGTASEEANVRLARLVADVESGARTVDDMRTSLETYKAGDQTDPNDTGDSPQDVRDAEDQQGEGVGGAGPDEETQLTILTSKEMEWNFDASSGKWYVSYGLPSSDRALVFEADPSQMDSLFGTNKRPQGGSRLTLEQLLRKPGTTFGGNIGQMSGTGSFEDEVRRMKTLALDNGQLPAWADADPEIMDIIYIAQAEGKNLDWQIDQISKTASFQERFPNISILKSSANLTMEEAITGFLEYEVSVKSAVKAIGGNPEATTPDVIGGLLKQGQSAETVVTAIGKFNRMQQYAPAIQAFNRVLAEQGKAPITSLQDMFDFVSGTASAETYAIWEASSVSEAAQSAGLSGVFTAEDAMQFAIETEGQTSLQDAMGAFQNAAQMLLRFRNEVDLGRYGLDQEDIIDLSLGRAPRSGTSAADLQDNMSRAVLSAKAGMRGRSKPFIGFTPEGVPQRASLKSLRSMQ